MQVASQKHSTTMTLNLLVALAVVVLSVYAIIMGLRESNTTSAFLPLAGIVALLAVLVVVTAAQTIKALREEPVQGSTTVWVLNGVALLLGLGQGVDFFSKSQFNLGELVSLVVAAMAFINLTVLLFATKASKGAR